MGNGRPTSTGVPVAQSVPQIRNQVNISQQQRMATPMGITNARLSPQQMLQAQAQVAQAAQARAMQVAAAQAHAAQNVVNSMGSNLSNSHLSPQYNNRATTSSPMPHSSPPHQSSSPHLPSAQAQVNMGPTPQVPGNAIPRQNMNHYFPMVPNMQMQQNMSTNNYTQESMEHAVRLQSLAQVNGLFAS